MIPMNVSIDINDWLSIINKIIRLIHFDRHFDRHFTSYFDICFTACINYINIQGKTVNKM